MLEGVWLDTEVSYRYERIAELAAEVVREDEGKGDVQYVHLGENQWEELTRLLNEVGALSAKWLGE